MSAPRIAAAIIAGDGVTGEEWERLGKSLDGQIEKVYIAYNGKDFPDLKCLTCLVPVQMTHFKWEDDFAQMRQNSFAMVDKKEFDWIFWLDTDDTLEGDLKAVISDLEPATQGVFLKYDYAVDPDTGTTLVEHWRERVFKTDAKWLWKYPIHEVCHGPPGTQYARRDQAYIRHWREEDGEGAKTRKRNRRILTKAMKEYPKESRFKYYFANETFAEAHKAREGDDPLWRELFQACINLYGEFIDEVPWQDDAYIANHRKAEAYRQLGQLNEAIDTDLQGVKVQPSWPDSYVGIAQSALEMNDLVRCRDWADLCIKACEKPITTQVIEPHTLGYTPYLLRGIARENLGELEAALNDFEKAAEVYLPDELESRMAELTERLSLVNNDEHLKTMRKKLYGGAQDVKSIAFVTAPLFEPWHPELEKVGGAGGAETCIMRLAPLFAAAGWRVVVFGTPGDHKGVDEHGIEWWDSEEFQNSEAFTVIVSSRAPELFDAELNAKVKLLWFHDVNSGPDAFTSEWGNRLEKIDKIIGLTDWHCQHLSKLYGIAPDKFAKIPNGIDLSLFDNWQGERDKHKVVYSSSPDRGLDVLLSIWPRIKHVLPEAELSIFYGWDAIDKIIAQGTQSGKYLDQFKGGIVRVIEELGGEGAGVYWKGRLPQSELAREFVTSGAWVYPTYFMETFCITAIEAQAAGMLPISSRLAGLEETVWDSTFLIDGYANNITYQDQWIDLLKRVLTADASTQDEWREKGREHAEVFTWENSYMEWVKLLMSMEVW